MSTARRSAFELIGADGGPLRGDIRTAAGGRGRPAVVLCHGFKGFKDWGFFPTLADRLAKVGLTVVSFNFSGSGIGSDGEDFTELDRFAHHTLSGDLTDLETIVSALGAGTLSADLEPAATYGIFGFSRGGGTALLHSARNKTVRALVTWNAIARVRRWDETTDALWRESGKMEVLDDRTGRLLPLHLDLLDDIDNGGIEFDLLRAAGRLESDWLIVHAADDEAVPVEEARELYAASGATSTELLLIEDGGHTFGVKHPFSRSNHRLDTAIDATIDWFGDRLF